MEESSFGFKEIENAGFWILEDGDMWKESKYLKNFKDSLVKIHIYTALVMLAVPTYIHFFAEVHWNNILEILVYCSFSCLPVLVFKKWLCSIKQILKGVKKEYVRKAIRTFRIYWIIMFLSICIYGSYDNAVMIAVIIIWPFRAFALMCIRSCIVSAVMEKHYPYIVHEVQKLSLQRDNMEIERILDELLEKTGIPKVRRVLEMRKAVFPLWILSVYVWFISLVFILSIYGVIVGE